MIFIGTRLLSERTVVDMASKHNESMAREYSEVFAVEARQVGDFDRAASCENGAVNLRQGLEPRHHSCGYAWRWVEPNDGTANYLTSVMPDSPHFDLV